MKVIYLTNVKPEFGDVALSTKPRPNKYGLLHSILNKSELATTELLSDYFVYKSIENGKWFLSIPSESQIGLALLELAKQLALSHKFQFKEARERIYIHMPDEMAASLPKNRNILFSVNVFAIFVQASTGTAFLQMEVSIYRDYPLVDFAIAEQRGFIV